ncbi:Zn-dependent exopeptidase [Wilcoxina mikolae CBS 423.85]|nr:Zn-dependent exopeptidase [Wilcoxina mikolae CBS 423.85]
MRFSIPLILLLLPCALSYTHPKPITPSHVVSDITSRNLLQTLSALSKIAASNGGNRAFGLSGYRRSVDYILSRIPRTISAQEQEFTALFALVKDIQLREVGAEEDVYVFGLTYSPSTNASGITAELALGPPGLPGCSAEGYQGLDVKDKIVLTQRFRCPDQTTLAGRVRAAVAAGAAAVIVYHDLPTKPTAGTLSAPDPVRYRPAGFIGLVDGEKWKARIEKGEKVRVYFRQIQVIEERKTWNVIAETRNGDPGSVIVFGAHLDSVQAGPGINDDGSGVSLILELLRSAAKYSTRMKLRFCFWGAEENGLLGSKYYVSALPHSDLTNIRAYLNFDMVSRGYFGVFDGDGSTHGLAGANGSAAIEALLSESLRKEGVDVVPVAFTGGSDYASFMAVGIPVGGLHTGAGIEQDPCYHQVCDGYDNANATTLTVMAKAAGYTMARLAVEGERLIPSGSTKWRS